MSSAGVWAGARRVCSTSRAMLPLDMVGVPMSFSRPWTTMGTGLFSSVSSKRHVPLLQIEQLGEGDVGPAVDAPDLHLDLFHFSRQGVGESLVGALGEAAGGGELLLGRLDRGVRDDELEPAFQAALHLEAGDDAHVGGRGDGGHARVELEAEHLGLERDDRGPGLAHGIGEDEQEPAKDELLHAGEIAARLRGAVLRGGPSGRPGRRRGGPRPARPPAPPGRTRRRRRAPARRPRPAGRAAAPESANLSRVAGEELTRSATRVRPARPIPSMEATCSLMASRVGIWPRMIRSWLVRS